MAKIPIPKNASCVINVSRQGLAMCGAGIGGVLEMPFTPGVVSDLDVVSLAELSGLVKSFVETNRVQVCDLVLVFSPDTYFEKGLTGDDAAMAQDVQDFVDSVPLTNPSSKIFKVGDSKSKVVVINRRLYESLRTAFEAVGFGVKAVVPELVLQEVGFTGAQFDLNACRLILKSQAHLLANSFIGPVAAVEEDTWINHHKKQATIMAVAAITVSVFGVVFIIWQTISARNAAIANAAARAAKAQQARATPIPTPAIPASASASANPADYTIQITGNTATVEELLKKEGFTNITLGSSESAAKSMVVFAVRVPQEIRTRLVGILTPVLGDVTVVENSQAQFDALISVAKTAP